MHQRRLSALPFRGLAESTANVVSPPATRRLLTAFLLAAATGLSSVSAHSQTVVTSLDDSGPGTLRSVLGTAEAGDTITFSTTGTINLESQLVLDKAINLDAGFGSVTLDGGSDTRILFIDAAGDIAITNINFVNGGAQGGNGGNGGFNGGGGGAGVGGAIFAKTGNITLVNTNFQNNIAIGGRGGVGDDSKVPTGDDSTYLSGSGGGGVSDGSNGIGASSPADGLTASTASPVRGAGGGTADINIQVPGGAGGGFSGSAENPSDAEPGTNGDDDNRGGGGGGGPSIYGKGGDGGDGGFGGGGGGAGDGGSKVEDDNGVPVTKHFDGLGGDGGFGGGGGGGVINPEDDFEPVDRGGVGGIGGGDGEITTPGSGIAGDGGGGAGAGGAVFIGTGASLTVQKMNFTTQTGNSVIAGPAGGANAQAGGAAGSLFFVGGNSALNIQVDSGQDQTLDATVIGDSTALPHRANLSSPFILLNKTGDGTLTIVGDNNLATNDAGFGGQFVVSSGNMIIDASASVFNIIESRSGGTIFGTGTVGSITNDTGRVNPGDHIGEIGTLTLVSNYEQRAGGNLDIEYGPTGIDQLDIAGTASLNGDLNFIEIATGVATGTPMTFLTADNILGNFDNINSVFFDNSALIEADVIFTIDATAGQASFGTVTFTPVIPTFGLAAGTSNATSIGSFLDNFNPAAAPADAAAVTNIMNGVLNGSSLVVNGAFNPAVANALESQTSVVSNAVGAGAAAAVTQVASIAQGRVSATSMHNAAPTVDRFLAAAPTSLDDYFVDPAAYTMDPELEEDQPRYEQGDFTLWAEAAGGKSEIESDNTAVGSESETFGMTLGAESRLSSHTIVGLFAGFTETSVDVEGLPDESDIENVQFGLYAGKQFKSDWSLNGTVSVGLLDIENTRQTNTGTAESSTEGMAILGSLEIGRDLLPGQTTLFSPFAGVEAAFVERDGYSETGAGALNLTVGDSEDEYLSSIVGFQLAARHQLNNHKELLLTGRLGWAHQFLDQSASTTSNFTALPTTSFSSNGPDRGRDSLRLGLSLNFSPESSDRWSVYARYTGDFAAGATDHIGQVGVRFTF